MALITARSQRPTRADLGDPRDAAALSFEARLLTFELANALLSLMMDPRWKEAVRDIEDQYQRISHVGYPEGPSTHIPSDLKGLELEIHRGLRSGVSSAGFWLVWCERGALVIRRFRRSDRWEILPDRTFKTHCGELYDELERWHASWPALSHKFTTKREALSVIRETLRRSSDQAGRSATGATSS